MKGKKRNIRIALVAIMILISFNICLLSVKAGYTDIDDSYYDAVTGVYEIPSDTYGRIEIPDGKTLVVESGRNVNATIGIDIASGGTLSVSGTITGTINPQNGSRLTLADKSCIPSGVILNAEEGDVNDDDMWWGDQSFPTFVYDLETGKWHFDDGINHDYDCSIYFNGCPSMTITYTFNSNTYTIDSPDSSNGISEYECDESGIPKRIKFNPTTIEGNKGSEGEITVNIVFSSSDKDLIEANFRGIWWDPWTDIKEENWNDETKTLNYKFTPGSPFNSELEIIYGYPTAGDRRAEGLINDNLYAYGDVTNDGTYDIEDVVKGLKIELYCRFFGDGRTLDCYEYINRLAYDDAGMSSVVPYPHDGTYGVTPDGSVTAYDAAGSAVTVDRYKYNLNLGVGEDDGQQISAEGYVYLMPAPYDVLVYTGSEFYIRNSASDYVVFNETTDPSKEERALCVNASFSPENVRIGGDGCSIRAQNISPEGSDVYCAALLNDSFSTGAESHLINSQIRIINPAKTYVVVEAEGEMQGVPGFNKDMLDVVAETGDSSKSINVYIGHNKVHISPLDSQVRSTDGNRLIQDVSLKNASDEDGVTITKISADDYELKFDSNYYDSVPIVVTYQDGTSAQLTLNRIGLVIKYQYTKDGPGVQPVVLEHGKDQDTSSKFTYDYEQGEHIVIYASYFQPSTDKTVSGSGNLNLMVTRADGTSYIIFDSSDKEVVTKGGTVKITDFIIAKIPSKHQDENGHFTSNIGDQEYGAISAIVINDGYDDSASYGGTQVGRGRGVYWNGHISQKLN